MEGFKKFILRGNVVELAVAVVIGAAFGSVVTSFVSAFITPLLGVFGGIPDFSGVYFSVNNSRFPIGEFINALLSFVVLAAVVYFFIVLPLNKLLDRVQKKEIIEAKVDPMLLAQQDLTAAVRELNATIQSKGI